MRSRAGTHGTCDAPPEPLARGALDACGRYSRLDGRDTTEPVGAHFSGARADAAPARIVPPERRCVQRTVSGPVRAGRRTKLLVKHLGRGDIALIDHEDLDRVSAEELVAAGVAAVLNCRASSSGAYPNMGPQLLVEAGILLVDLPDDTAVRRAVRRRPARRRRRRAGRAGGRRGAAQGAAARQRRGARPRARARGDGRAAQGDRRGAGALRPQHDRAHARGARAAGRRDRAAALRHGLSRPLDARRRARRRTPARPARAAPVHPRHATGDRRGRRRRRGAAGRRPEAGHDRRRHGLGRRGRAALRRRARRAQLSRRARARAASAWKRWA